MRRFHDFADINRAIDDSDLGAGLAFFIRPKTTGPINGLQAEFTRVPLGDPSLVKLPAELTHDQAILLSDILPTGDFGADCAEIQPGDTVCVFGCGPA